MTQVKTLHFDGTGEELDFVKVTYLDGSVVCLDTPERNDVASVLVDLDDGLFDDDFHWRDGPEAVALWDERHPNAELIYGE